MTKKYTLNKPDWAIFNYQNGGLCFGSAMLKIIGNPLNKENLGYCRTGKDRGYDIEGDESPLTNQKNNFTCN